MSLSDAALTLAAPFTRVAWDLPGVVRISQGLNRGLARKVSKPLRNVRMRDGSRFQVDLRSATEWHAFYSGRSDDFWVNLGFQLLRGNETYLDVGANVGMYGIRVALLRKQPGKVICFEPMPTNLASLHRNVALNYCEARVTICPFGLSDTDTTLGMSMSAYLGGVSGNAAITADGDTPVEVRRLDGLDILGDAPVGVVKVDIEGHEEQFFRGAKEMLERDRPCIIAEMCRDFLGDTTPEQVYRDALPPSYQLYREAKGRLIAATFAEIGRLENILLVPEEKISRLA